MQMFSVRLGCDKNLPCRKNIYVMLKHFSATHFEFKWKLPDNLLMFFTHCLNQVCLQIALYYDPLIFFIRSFKYFVSVIQKIVNIPQQFPLSSWSGMQRADCHPSFIAVDVSVHLNWHLYSICGVCGRVRDLILSMKGVMTVVYLVESGLNPVKLVGFKFSVTPSVCLSASLVQHKNSTCPVRL